MQTINDLTFEALVRRYRQPLAATAYHLCGNKDAAQDIVQETLMDAYRGFDKLREPEKAGAWLYAILRRKAISYQRSKKQVVELIDDQHVTCPEAAESLVRDIVIEQMSKLPEEDREILAGKYLLGLSYRELADSFGIKEGAVRVRCFRAKEKLREALHSVGMKFPQKSDRNDIGFGGGDE